ncbi:hypothetical protein AB0910_13625 [Streptomyces sp. NPDC047002]|uniref:hypothetical protein n=1 Tax=Streptomyces sp. NPDC047002 TaxID=3155475 RepID=UPI003452EB21
MFNRKHDRTEGAGVEPAREAAAGPLGEPPAGERAEYAGSEDRAGDAGADEELPRSAAGEATEADARAGTGPGTSESELFADRERIVRRERALQQERDRREDGAGRREDSAGRRGAVAGALRTSGAGRAGSERVAGGEGSVAAVAEGRLMPRAESEEFGRRLQGALTHFVDDPGRSVEEAARVLEEAAKRLSAALDERPRALRASWQDGTPAEPAGADTERLRQALRTYRETTERLLAL